MWVMAPIGDRMTIVVKRDSKKERFDERKLRRSIEAAAREAKLPEERVMRIVREVSGNIIPSVKNEKEVRSTTIRESILNKLDLAAPDVSRSWRDYDRRTKGLT